jgi:type 1 fimbriae regulatory protein FimB/type 1 fimbriae regulatory protein FimE
MPKSLKKKSAPKTAPMLLNGKVAPKRRATKVSKPRSQGAPSPSIPPRRTSNLDRRTREYLTPAEVEKLLQASAKVGRHGARDRTLILLAYRHGLRVSELVTLRWEQIDFKAGSMHVNRLKNGVASTHPIRGVELRALRELRRVYPDLPYVFVTEREGPMTAATARKLIARAGELAKLPFPIHPHMLRHACGFKLASEGQDTRAIQQYLGHKNITHTVRYTELSPDRFKNFWRD